MNIAVKNKYKGKTVCCYNSFPRPWQRLFGFTLATCIWDWYVSDNNLRGTPRGSRKKPNAGRSPTCRLSTDVLCRGREKNGMVGAWHGHGMASVNRLSTCAPDGHLQVWWYQMLYTKILTSWWWAQQCSKHVEAYNKLIIKQDFVH